MQPYMYEHFGNPSSTHIYGQQVRVSRCYAQTGSYRAWYNFLVCSYSCSQYGIPLPFCRHHSYRASPSLATVQTSTNHCSWQPDQHPVRRHFLQTRAAVDTARQQVATLINCQPSEVYFTSCGTESDNWALFGAVMAKKDSVEGLPHVVTSQIEHPAVTACLQNMASLVSSSRSGSSCLQCIHVQQCNQ